MNINSNFEKKYYENIEFWSKEIPERELHRIKTISSYIPDDVHTVLDVGCGNGIFVNYLKDNFNRFNRIHGMDRSKSAIKYVKTERSLGNIDKLNFKDNEFDLVVCLEVLEHLPVNIYQKALNEISRVSKKYIIITVPNNEDLSKHHIECPGCKTKFHISLHLRSFNKETMQNLFSDNNFFSKQIMPIGENSYYRLVTPLKRLINKINGKSIFKLAHTVICPVCGLVKRGDKSDPVNINTYAKKKSRFISKIQNYWPKKNNYLWLFGLYIKSGN